MGFLLATVVKYLATIYRRAKHPDESFLILSANKAFLRNYTTSGAKSQREPFPHIVYTGI